MDLTPECQADAHQNCNGSLPERVDYHWWCACPCHPDQEATTKDEILARAVRRQEQEQLFTAMMDNIKIEAYGTVTNPPEKT